MNKHKLQKQITRNKIFDSTATLVMTFGYSAVNVTKIVTHAKISRGTFYQHFIDIRDVFEQMNDYILKQLEMLQIKFQKHIKVVIRGFCCKVFQKIYFSVKLRKKTERTE